MSSKISHKEQSIIMHYAAFEGNIDQVNKLIKAKNNKNEDGLRGAVEGSHVHLVELFLNRIKIITESFEKYFKLAIDRYVNSSIDLVNKGKIIELFIKKGWFVASCKEYALDTDNVSVIALFLEDNDSTKIEQMIRRHNNPSFRLTKAPNALIGEEKLKDFMHIIDDPNLPSYIDKFDADKDGLEMVILSLTNDKVEEFKKWLDNNYPGAQDRQIRGRMIFCPVYFDEGRRNKR